MDFSRRSRRFSQIKTKNICVDQRNLRELDIMDRHLLVIILRHASTFE